MELKANLLDESGAMWALMRVAHEIIERNKGAGNILLVGIKPRGVPLAQKIGKIIKQASNVDPLVGELEFETKGRKPVLKSSNVPAVDGKNVILVNDVMFTGRTVHEAVETILEQGEALSVQLAVLIDRGHRELPLRPDYVGKNVPSSKRELVSVNIPPCDKTFGVDIFEL